MKTMIKKIYNFYKDGFKEMTVGKKLWLIIGLKLFFMFAILKVFFFQGYLSSNFENDEAKSNHVFKQLTR